jgi:hypothetical protein
MLLQYTFKDLEVLKDSYVKTLTDSSLEFGEPIDDLSEVICSRFLEYLSNQKIDGSKELTKAFISGFGIENNTFTYDDMKYRLCPIEKDFGYEGFLFQVFSGTHYITVLEIFTVMEFLSIYKIITKQQIK